MGSKIIDSAETTVKGSFSLFVGNTIAVIVNAVGAILVARMLSPSEYGLFTISLILPGFFNLFTTWGVNQALVRFIAQNRTKNSLMNIRDLIRAGYFFSFIVGGLLSLILFLSADRLAVLVLNKPGIGNYIRITSLLILSQSTFLTGQAIFTGYEKMTYRASINVLQSLIKGILSPLLVYVGFSVSGVVIGHTLSYMIASSVGFFLVLRLIRNFKGPPSYEPSLTSLKLLIGFGLPIYFSNMFMGVASQFRGVLISRFLPNDVIGNYGVANWFSILVGVITMSIGVTFFPAFSKYDVNHEAKRTRSIYRGSVRYSTVLLIPIISMLIAAANPSVTLLFGSKYPQAPRFLSLLLMPSLYICLGSLSNNKFLNSQGETRATLIINSFGSIITILLSFLFIQYWSIEGLLVSIILSDLIKNVFGIFIINKKYSLKPNLSHSAKTLLSSAISGGLSLVQQTYIKTPYPFVNLILTTFVFLSSYLIVAPLLGAIDNKDLSNLDSLLKNLRILYPFARIILRFEEKMLKQ